MNIFKKMDEMRAKASGRSNVRMAKELQTLKKQRVKSEGKAKLKSKIKKEKARIKTSRGGSFLDKITTAKKKLVAYEENREKEELKKLKREVAIAKLKKRREKYQPSKENKKTIITIGGKGGGFF